MNCTILEWQLGMAAAAKRVNSRKQSDGAEEFMVDEEG